MGKLIVHNERVQDAAALIKICPFGAMENINGKIEINSACRLCKLCVKRGGGVFEFVEESAVGIDKSKWRGIAVYVDHVDGRIHPITYELIGKANHRQSKSARRQNQSACVCDFYRGKYFSTRAGDFALRR